MESVSIFAIFFENLGFGLEGGDITGSDGALLGGVIEGS